MAAALLEPGTPLPGFAAELARLEQAFERLAGWSISALIAGTSARELDRPANAHAAIFTIQVALAHSLMAARQLPDVLIGHSGGEVAATVIAGVLSLEDGVRVVLAQGELMDAAVPGSMLHVEASADALAAWLAQPGEHLGAEIAVRNAERAFVLATTDAKLAPLIALLQSHGAVHRPLRIRVPFHTASVDPGMAQFRHRVAEVRAQPARIPLYSAWRGALAQPGDFDAAYWACHVREPVRFFEAARAMFDDGVREFVEVSPHPVLLHHLADIGHPRPFVGLATLHREAGLAALTDWLPGAPPAGAPPVVVAIDADDLQGFLRESLLDLRPVPSGALPQDWLERTWSELGLSSAQLVALGQRLAQQCDRALPTTLAYRCPTPLLLIDHLCAKPAAAAPARTATSGEPIAIIGMACRFPGGANSPEAYWKLLASERDAIGEIPPNRWSIADHYDATGTLPGKSRSRWGGFIEGHDLHGFDERLFRLTPREASALDPQQRLLLEVTWEALENAGLAPLSLKGKRVAVYTGISTDDHKASTLYAPDLAEMDPYSGSGVMACTASGRLSYFFGWQGANIAIDTACSSSLVALHLAAQALRNGECDLAVVTGVNTLLSPHLFVYFSRVGALSPTGRCRTFDAAADGYVRGEGCGVLVLEHAASALAHGRRPRALVAASVVNQDGASTGFSAPNGAAQTDLLRQAWSLAGAIAADLAYVEAHGTGTPVGDPIELEALSEALAPRDSSDPLLVGSAKSRIGHLESAAGVAGVIKVVLSLEHAQVPGNLHFQHPNPRLDWARLPLRVVTRLQPWPVRGSRRLAGVSSFGFSGTNAHVVIEGVEGLGTASGAASAGPPADTAVAHPALVLRLSAPDQLVLAELARLSAQALSACGDVRQAADLLWSSNTARQGFAQRVALAARHPADLVQGLQDYAAGQPVSAKVRMHTGRDAPARLVFAYTGQGCQYPGMAQALYAQEAVYRQTLDECDALFITLRGHSLLPWLLDPKASVSELDATELAQPAIFMVQLAQTRLWAARGVRPDHVVGHSVGEVAAGVTSGVLSLRQGLTLIELRGRLMGTHPKTGGMAVLPVDEARASAAIAAVAPGELFIACVNAPSLVVLSGGDDAMARVTAALQVPPAQVRRLRNSLAFHTPELAPLAQRLAEQCPDLAGNGPGSVPWLSSMDGRRLDQTGAGPTYWAQQMQSPVRFDAALHTLEAAGCSSFVEIGPSAMLSALGSERAHSRAGHAGWAPTQQRQVDPQLTLWGALANLAAAGHPIDWNAWQQASERRRVNLPPYPFQRRRHWRSPAPAATLTPPPSLMNPPMTSPPVDDTAVDTVRALVAEITGMALPEIDAQAAFLDLGMDSLMLVRLKQLLEQQRGLSVEMVDLYDGAETSFKLAQRLPSTPRPVVAAAMPMAASAAQTLPVTQVAVAPVATPVTVSHLAPVRTQAAMGLQAHGEVAGLMALQLETLSRLMSEQLSLLSQSASVATAPMAALPPPAAVPMPAAAPAKAAASAPPPNFRSLKLDADSFTSVQRAFVDDLTRRYVARTPGSRELAQAHRGALCDWKNTLSYRHSLKEMTYPIAAQRSAGAHFTDVDGNEFLDITMGCGIGILGHAPDYVVKAVIEQTQTHFGIGPQTPLAADVANTLCRITGNERVTFCNTGAEAVMMAVRIARAVTGRQKIVIFGGAYHGTWDGVLGVDHDGHVVPIADGIPQGMVDDLVILDYGTDEALETLERCAGELAAVLVEPVQSRKPGLQPKAFLQALRRITNASGSALIFDEVITGFRIGPGGAQAHFGVRADLVTYGKIAGGGMPLSAVAGTAHYMDRVDGGPWRYGDDSMPRGDVIYFGGTFVKHPLVLAASKAALQHIETQGQPAYDRLNALTADMAAQLNSWFTAERVPLQVVHFGSLFRIDGSGRYNAMLQPVELDLFFFLLLLRSIYVWERRVLFLSFAHGPAEVTRLVDAVKDAIAELRAGGFAFAAAGGAAPGKSEEERACIVVPASSAHRRFFALDQIEGRNTVYNVPLSLRLDGALNRARLRGCLDQLVQRHEALRTRFVLHGEQLVQEILPAAQAPLLFEEADCARADFKAALTARILPFDFGVAPLMRVALLSDGPDCHALLIDAHHIVVDGLSLNIIARDLMTLYDGRPLGQQPAPAREALAAQQAYLDSAAFRNDAQWWQQQLATPPAALDLPLDKPRPPQRAHRGADALLGLDGAGTAALKNSARRNKLTLFGLCFGVFAGLLHRLSGQSDLVVAVPVGGRQDARFANTVGMFANTLPLRLQADGQTPLGDFARHCQRTFLQALAHQAYPLETLIGELRLPRDLSRNPLFDTMFIFEDGNDRVYQMQGLICTPLHASRRASMFDLALEVIEAQGQLQLRLEYDSDLFEAATADHLVALYRQMLLAAPGALDVPLGQLALVDASARAHLLALGDGGASPEPCTSIVALLARQLAARPEAPALEFAGHVLSYRALDAQARVIAHALRVSVVSDSGASASSPYVALVAERGSAMLAGMLGIVLAGAAYVPVDPDFPSERVALMLEDSGCQTVLLSAALRDSLRLPAGVRVLVLEELLSASAIAAQSSLPLPPLPLPHADDDAYLIYTSGSTGRPKGTRVRQRNAASFFAALPQAFGFTPGQRILALTTMSFDIAGLELLGALCCGMTVVMASTAQARDPAQLRALLRAAAVDVLQITPTRLRLLLELCDDDAALAGLSTLLVGGEALPADLAATLATQQQQRAFDVFNVYGPTETTIWSAASRVQSGAVSLGHALPGERLFVLSEQFALQPVGAIGEIAIGGDGVGAGYYQRADLSAERFRTLPDLCTGPVYLTGDLGRWDAQGHLQFLGRRDAQLKLRGVRVELGEIEHHLRMLPGVQDAVVTAPTDARGETQLVAYVVSGLQADAPQVAAWRSHLATSLPEAMLPAQFVVLAALPQTPNGKTDRRALPAPSPMQTALSNATPRAVTSPVEHAIVQVFAEVLGAPIGPDEDFFVRGGDSLRAIRAVASLRRAGWLLDAQTLFRHASAATLAAHLGQSPIAKKAEAIEAVEAIEVVKVASLLDDDTPTFSGLDSDEIDSLFI